MTRGARLFRSSRRQCFEQRDVDHAVVLGHADPVAEIADRLGRVAAAAQAARAWACAGRPSRVTQPSCTSCSSLRLLITV